MKKKNKIFSPIEKKALFLQRQFEDKKSAPFFVNC